MLNELLRKIAQSLNSHKIPYMIIRGQAALIYREPRFTNDIDIILGIDIDSINIILQICEDYNFTILVENPLEFTSQTMILPAYDEKSKMRIDFIFSTTKYEREAITRANIINIDNCEIAFCSLEDLIILKLFAGRAIDIEDVKSIIRRNPNYNYDLVYNTLKDLGDATDTDLLQRLIELDKRT